MRALARARVLLVEAAGLVPSPTLRNLEHAILAQSSELAWQQPRWPPALPARAAGASPPPGEPRLVGRRDELALLTSALDSAAGGAGAFVVVSGEPGIGKSRLMDELQRGAVARDMPVALAVGHDGEGAPPFWPWVQVVRALTSQYEPELLRAALARRAAAIAPVVAEVLDVVSEPARLPRPDGEAPRALFFDAVVGLICQLADRRPLLIVLEDLHWADAASLELAQLLASQIRGSPVLVVVTHSDVELGAQHPLLNLLSMVAGHQGARFLTLAGLSPSEVEEFLGNVMGSRPPAALVATVHERTEGNPFFVAELSRLLAGEEVAAVAVDAVPHRVRAVIRRRLGRLDQATNKALVLASVIGREFDFRLLADVTATTAGLDEPTLLAAIESAVVAGLLAEVPSVVGRYRFSHSIVRHTIYEGIGSIRRARAHAQIGEALDATPSHDPDFQVALAHHFFQAAPAIGPSKGIAHLVRAADLAEARLAYEQAAEHLQRALDLMNDAPERAHQILVVYNRLAVLTTLIKGFADPGVDAAWTKAAMLAPEPDAGHQVPQSLWGMATLALGRAELGATEKIGVELLSAGPASGSRWPEIAGHLATGMAAFHRGWLRVSVDHMRSARHGCDSLENQRLDVFIVDPAVYALGYLSAAYWLQGDTDHAAQLAAEMAEVAAQGAPAFSRIAALTLDAIVAAIRRDTDTARRRAEEILATDRSHDGTALATLVHAWSLGGAPDAPSVTGIPDRTSPPGGNGLEAVRADVHLPARRAVLPGGVSRSCAGRARRGAGGSGGDRPAVL